MTHNYLYRVAFLILLLPNLSVSAESTLTRYKINFDTTEDGQLPTSWQITETSSSGFFGANRQSKNLAKWQVKRDKNASSGQNSMAIFKSSGSPTTVYNILYNNAVKFKNGIIKVKVRANSGVIDQGGGPVWRYKDNRNYYVARYNPLERNFRLYYVKQGNRVQLKSARDIQIKQGEWFEIKIEHQDNHISAWLDGKKLLDVNDNTHQTAGAVGLWTKADALTQFDDFSVIQQ